MNVLREFFETDFAGLPHHALNGSQRPERLPADLDVRVHYDFRANCKFISCFVPADHAVETVCDELLVTQNEILSVADCALDWIHGMPGDVASLSSDLRFGGRLFAYHERPLPSDVIERVRHRAGRYDTSIKFRGLEYMNARLVLERPRAFILHDARDTNHIARPLAHGLAHRGCLVWFYSFSLDTGVKPTTVFAEGVKGATCCILVVSPNLLKSPVWNPMEFHRIVSPRLRQPRLLHAVWYGVTSKQVRDFSPALAERASLRWDLGPEQDAVIKELHRALTA